jgi:2-phosphoglycerate kinase
MHGRLGISNNLRNEYRKFTNPGQKSDPIKNHVSNHNLKVILLGGSSHSGKSTLAKTLGRKLGWSDLSTDRLARHPGRPWRPKGEPLPEHVAKHYAALSADELIVDVLRHYRSMWPGIETLIRMYAAESSGDRLILEGSALWPATVAKLNVGSTAALWLTASDDIFQRRIYKSSGYYERSVKERFLIDQFLARTIRYDSEMMAEIERLGLLYLPVDDDLSSDALSDRCLDRLFG